MHKINEEIFSVTEIQLGFYLIIVACNKLGLIQVSELARLFLKLN
jgi:hypothetical protein